MDMKDDPAKKMDEALAALGIHRMEPQQPDEFTLEELRTHLGGDGHEYSHQLRVKVKQEVAAGRWTRRKLGRSYLYRRVTPNK